MKKSIFSALMLIAAFQMEAQQLFIETFSGYHITNYSDFAETESTGYVPIGVRLTGGFEKIQFGGEYHRNLTNATWEAGDPILRQEVETEYYGGLVRVNISSLPAYRFGLVLKAGAGMYNMTGSLYGADDVLQLTADYESAFGFNGGIGISAPIVSQLHWEIGYMYHYVDEVMTGPTSSNVFGGSFHAIQVGLSLNFVFGNVAKKCRRIIKSEGRGPGYRR